MKKLEQKKLFHIFSTLMECQITRAMIPSSFELFLLKVLVSFIFPKCEFIYVSKFPDRSNHRRDKSHFQSNMCFWAFFLDPITSNPQNYYSWLPETNISIANVRKTSFSIPHDSTAKGHCRCWVGWDRILFCQFGIKNYYIICHFNLKDNLCNDWRFKTKVKVNRWHLKLKFQ